MERHRKTSTGSNTFDRPTVFDPEKKGLYVKTFLDNHVAIAEELTAAMEAVSYRAQDIFKALTTSGFLVRKSSVGVMPKKGLEFGDHANAYSMSALHGPIQPISVNGYLVRLGGTSTDADDPFSRGNNNDKYVTITLPDPPSSGSREDFVFLEIWTEELNESSTIYPWGNTQYLGSNLTNDLINTDYVTDLQNKDIAIRYRIRTVSDVDFSDNPYGFGDSSVLARGPQSNPITGKTFTNMGDTLGDYGLWRAGTGSDVDVAALGTTTGYVYGIPLQRIHRRNTGAYNAETNANGAGETIGNTSDRPDGLFNDQVVAEDVQDLRLFVLPGTASNDEIIRYYNDSLFAGETKLFQAVADLSPEESSNSNPGGIKFNTDRRNTFAAGETSSRIAVSLNANYSNAAGPVLWDDASDTVTLDATLIGGPGAVIAETPAPQIFRASGGTFGDEITATWSGLGTAQATATISRGSTTSLAFECTITYPGERFTKFLPTDLHSVFLDIESTDYTAVLTTSTPALSDVPAAATYPVFFVQYDANTYEILSMAVAREITTTGRTYTTVDNVLEVSDNSATYNANLIEGLTSGETIQILEAYHPAGNRDYPNWANGTAYSVGDFVTSVDTPASVYICIQAHTSTSSGATADPGEEQSGSTSYWLEYTRASSVNNYYGADGDEIGLVYSYAPFPGPALPTTLEVEIFHGDTVIYVSNLGRGGGTEGAPYTYPTEFIPANNPDFDGDHLLENTTTISLTYLARSPVGWLQVPLFFRDIEIGEMEMSRPATDVHDRPHYRETDRPFEHVSTDLRDSQWHRTMYFCLAKVTASSGSFLEGEVVLLCFTKTTNDVNISAGLRGSGTATTSDACCGVYKTNILAG